MTQADLQQDYQTLHLDQLVNLFAFKDRRNKAITALVGGLTATELRRVRLTDEALQALAKGLEHPNPKVRWWCLQLMDHLADDRCIEPMSRALHDPVPRVRKHALHALTCEVCKNQALCPLSPEIVEHIIDLALHDSHASVREAAVSALGTLHCEPRVDVTLQTILQQERDGTVLAIAQRILAVYSGRSTA